jgi:hypothetical protein
MSLEGQLEQGRPSLLKNKSRKVRFGSKGQDKLDMGQFQKRMSNFGGSEMLNDIEMQSSRMPKIRSD